MTTLTPDQPGVTTELAPAIPTPARPRARAGTAIGVHTVCDYFSFITIATLPLLTTHLSLTTDQKAMLIGLGSIASGIVQPIVAWISDKLDTRVFGTIGLAVAVVCLSNVGHAETFAALMVLHGVGAAGVGAFHPPAAAAVGRLSGRKRALGMASFFLAGMAGGIACNTTAQRVVAWSAERLGAPGLPDYAAGLASLSWLMIPGLAACVVLGWAIHKAPHRHHAAHEHHGALPEDERRRRWGAVGVIYASNVLRFGVNVALIYLFNEWAQAWTLRQEQALELTDALGAKASLLNGPLQAAMQIGMGTVGLAFGFVLAPRFEKHVFVGVPMVGACVIALAPSVEALPTSWVSAGMFAVSVVAGVGFGSMIPVSMTAAQRLLPHRTSLASGMMLGGAWVFAFIGSLGAEAVQGWWGLDAAFYATAGVLALAGALCFVLPGRLLADAIDHQ